MELGKFKEAMGRHGITAAQVDGYLADNELDAEDVTEAMVPAIAKELAGSKLAVATGAIARPTVKSGTAIATRRGKPVLKNPVEEDVFVPVEEASEQSETIDEAVDMADAEDGAAIAAYANRKIRNARLMSQVGKRIDEAVGAARSRGLEKAASRAEQIPLMDISDFFG
ncbi:MAG: hypothetical protein ACRC62_15390 [Microcoleus sp.]